MVGRLIGDIVFRQNRSTEGTTDIPARVKVRRRRVSARRRVAFLLRLVLSSCSRAYASIVARGVPRAPCAGFNVRTFPVVSPLDPQVERAQQELNKQKATFAAHQVGNTSGGYYPHLPQQNTATGRGYMGGPPPGYTPSAVSGNGYAAAPGYGQSAAGTGVVWGGGTATGRGATWGNPGYPSHAGGVGQAAAGSSYGAQASHTQRR